MLFVQEEELAADESLREALQELQARGVECLSHREVEVFLAGLYRIQAKLSYILEVVEQVFLSSSQPVKMVEYCLHGLNLATQLYGEQAEQVKTCSCSCSSSCSCSCSCSCQSS